MKDWLTIIIVILIVGIVLDGVRRMRLAKRENIKLSKNAKKADLEADLPVSSSEFPSGGARVAAYRDDDAEISNKAAKQHPESGALATRGAKGIPEQVSLNLGESVPMLMDSVDSADDDVEAKAEPHPQYVLDAEGDALEEDFREPQEPQIGSLEGLQEADEPLDETHLASSSSHDKHASSLSEDTAGRKEPKKAAPEAQPPEEVLIVNVMAKSQQRFHGKQRLESVVEQGLKLGEMEIFHRHKDNDGDGPILFSLANMVVPGTFKLAEMDAFETPGVSLFLSLPVAGESIAAYDDMIATAKHLANMLEGELKDENRSVMTSQTIEHDRQRVMEFERKQKLHA